MNQIAHEEGYRLAGVFLKTTEDGRLGHALTNVLSVDEIDPDDAIVSFRELEYDSGHFQMSIYWGSYTDDTGKLRIEGYQSFMIWPNDETSLIEKKEVARIRFLVDVDELEAAYADATTRRGAQDAQ